MNAAKFAGRYCECGLALTWSPPGVKGPRHFGWNDPAYAITDPGVALQFWREHPQYGIGALLKPSRKVSLDVDHVLFTRTILKACDIDLDAINGPRIVGNPTKYRLMFEAPAGMELSHRTAAWPQQQDLRKSFAIFELRAGLVSDALPPTIHVGTGRPYCWAIPPRNGFPELPAEILDLWLAWPVTEKRIRALCPWAPPPPPDRPSPARRRPAEGPSVIDAFNAAHDVAVILECHGYVRHRGNRFASPDTHHAAGVVLLESGKIYCHHQGDLLGGGVARDAFDVWCVLEHRGDVRAAVRAAARALGMQRQERAA